MNIAVLGSGAWGCTLAHHLSKIGGHQLTLWEHDPERKKQLEKVRHPFGIDEYKLSDDINITSDLEEVLDCCRTLLVVIPAQKIAGFVSHLEERIGQNDHTTEDYQFLLASKGIDLEKRLPLSEFFAKSFPKNSFAVLSGPCIAKEIAQGIPTSVVVSSANRAYADLLIERFSNETMRCYYQPDVLGVELGGALKNCIAIAAGISDGLGFGENTKSALLARGLAEISRLSASMGADEQTIYGLAGLGDLAVTCFSPHSRNRTFGEKLGKGISPEDAKKEINMTVEGEMTAKAAYEIAANNEVEVPIIEAVVKVCDGVWKPGEAVKNLMNRELKTEF